MYHCSRTAFNIFRGTFEVENFDWDPPFQRSLSRFWVVCSNFCRNVFRTVLKTAFCVSRRKFWLIFLQKLRLFPQVWANIYRSLDRKVSPLFSEQNSTCSEEQLEKKASFTLLIFFLFWVTSSCSFGKSTSAGLSKLNSTFPGETFGNLFWKTSNFAYFSDLKRKKTAI